MNNIQAIFDANPRVAEVVEYPHGFVPNSYKYKCVRERVRHFRNGGARCEKYDAKRSHGRGPAWVALSERGGRLASG